MQTRLFRAVVLAGISFSAGCSASPGDPVVVVQPDSGSVDSAVVTPDTHEPRPTPDTAIPLDTHEADTASEAHRDADLDAHDAFDSGFPGESDASDGATDGADTRVSSDETGLPPDARPDVDADAMDMDSDAALDTFWHPTK